MMRPLPPILAAVAVMALLPFLVRGDDDDPKIEGMKTSEWLAMFRELRDAKPADATEAERNVEKRRVILQAVLRKAGPKVPGVQAEVLKALASDPSDRIKATAATWLGDTARQAKDDNVKPDKAFDGLTTALREDKVELVRAAAAKALGEMARHYTDMRPAVPALSAAVKDSSMEVRASAAEALGRIGRDSMAAVGNLMEALRDTKGDRYSRGFAAIALVRIDPTDDRIARALGEVLGEADAKKGVREDAARALALMGKDASPAVDPLAKLLSDKDIELRLQAATALAAVGPDARTALKALQEALKDSDKGVRAQVIFAIGNIGLDAADAVPNLVETLKDANAEVRLAAVRALAAIGGPAKPAVPALKALLQDPTVEIRNAAKDAIQKIQ
jgi:HEAT repeat protein